MNAKIHAIKVETKSRQVVKKGDSMRDFSLNDLIRRLQYIKESEIEDNVDLTSVVQEELELALYKIEGDDDVAV